VRRGAPRIAVVGAGLAGLTCAYRLQQAGYVAQVYEASGRIGGRCYTGRGDFADGQIYEHGGELIDTRHRELRRLAQELELQLDDLLNAEQVHVQFDSRFWRAEGSNGETYSGTGHQTPRRYRVRRAVRAASSPTTRAETRRRRRQRIA